MAGRFARRRATRARARARARPRRIRGHTRGPEVTMRKAEIDALVRAHRGRARPVAFFHVLRQSALEPDDHAFLLEHVEALGASDLLRWRARCEEGFTAPVIRQLARRAVDDPGYFQHEVLDLPKIELHE